ncbi:MAG: hypothetical protein LBF00_02060 [Mycoplasmataceae bacterium]|jgi:hypothetical protein|nr:hypothetical protein [Mycoplasmataceae bacterium]
MKHNIDKKRKTKIVRINELIIKMSEDIKIINVCLNKQDEFNQYVKDVFERNNLH